MNPPQTLADSLRRIADAMDAVMPFWQAVAIHQAIGHHRRRVPDAVMGRP